MKNESYKVLIVGAGNMGSGIAQKLATEGMEVFLNDRSQKEIETGIEKIRALLNEGVERKIFKPAQITEILGRIKPHSDLKKSPKDLFLVIEAAFEDEKVKIDIFKILDKVCGPETIFASNTSSLSINKLGKSTNREELFCGLHFFFHPAKNRLLEIILPEKPHEELSQNLEKWANAAGKTAIWVQDKSGFCVNRFFVPFLNEATRLLEKGVSNISTIEKTCKDILGIGMGPFELMNVTGIPIAYHSCQSLASLGKFYLPTATLEKQFKSGKPWDLEGKIEKKDFEAIEAHILGAIFLIVSHLIDEGVCLVEDIEIGAKVGLRWKRGPFEKMNQIGLEAAYPWVRTFFKEFGLSESPFLESHLLERREVNIKTIRPMIKSTQLKIILNRPDALNAINEKWVSDFQKVMYRVADEPKITSITLVGSGKAFVAGADIKFFVDKIENKKIKDIITFTEAGQELFNLIAKETRPTIAMVHGLALGGGLELALACNYLVVSSKALLGFPETGIGIYPALGGTQRTPQKIGVELTRYLLFTGQLLSAQDAYEIGLADAMMETEELEADPLELKNLPGKSERSLPLKWEKIRSDFTDKKVAGLIQNGQFDLKHPLLEHYPKIGRKAPLAIELSEKLIQFSKSNEIGKGLKEELKHLKKIFSTKDALIGLKSVGGKPPVYSGN